MFCPLFCVIVIGKQDPHNLNTKSVLDKKKKSGMKSSNFLQVMAVALTTRCSLKKQVNLITESGPFIDITKNKELKKDLVYISQSLNPTIRIFKLELANFQDCKK